MRGSGEPERLGLPWGSAAIGTSGRHSDEPEAYTIRVIVRLLCPSRLCTWNKFIPLRTDSVANVLREGIMANAGIALFLIGLGILIVYGVYSILWAIYSEGDVPLILKVVTPVIVGGVTLLLIGVIRDRLRDRGREKFEEVES